MSENEDLKAKMREALAKKNLGHDAGVAGEGHGSKERGPAERGRQGGGREFRRKSGG
jgi:hypothetical protein